MEINKVLLGQRRRKHDGCDDPFHMHLGVRSFFVNQVASKILANLLLLFLFIATFVHQKRSGHKVYAGMALVVFILWTMMFIYYLTTLF